MRKYSKRLTTLLSIGVISAVLIACGSSSDDDIITYGQAGDQELFTIARLSDGGYLLGGNYDDDEDGPFSPVSGGVPDYYLIKTDSDGDVVWTQIYGDANRDFVTKVAETADGNILVAGNAQLEDNSYAGQIAKLTQDGEAMWAVSLDAGGNEIIWDMKELSDGNIVVVGGLFDPITFTSDSIISKFNSVGEMLWWRTYGDEANELMLDVLEVEGGGLIVVGNKTTGTNTDMVLWRLNSDGDLLYQKDYATANYESASGVIAATGGYLITGTAVTGATNDITMIRTDALGEVIWQKYFGDEENDVGSEAVATSDGGFVVVGTDTLSSGDTRIIVLKVDSAGNQLWERSYGDVGLNYGSDIVNTSDGFAVSGYGDSLGSGGLDGYLLLLDNDGELI